jgi:hypothetical protein
VDIGLDDGLAVVAGLDVLEALELLPPRVSSFMTSRLRVGTDVPRARLDDRLRAVGSRDVLLSPADLSSFET